jgi:hypothetical protein
MAMGKRLTQPASMAELLGVVVDKFTEQNMSLNKLIICAALSIVTLNAHAWSMWELNGAKMDIDGKDIRVASVKTDGSDHVFHRHDAEFEKGIYVVAVVNESSIESLPKTTTLIREGALNNQLQHLG